MILFYETRFKSFSFSTYEYDLVKYRLSFSLSHFLSAVHTYNPVSTTLNIRSSRSTLHGTPLAREKNDAEEQARL